jgi:short-subunit dehydrogenase
MSTTRLAQRYGPWAVVTGASDGIGRAFARTLAGSGLNLVLVARRANALESLRQELRAETGVDLVVLPVDLSRPGSLDTLVAHTSGLDVGLLVAAAGFGTSGRFLDQRLEDELEMIDVNCRAVAALTHHFARRFAHRGRGGIVLLSSLVAFQGVARAANYAATKAYVQSLAEGLRAELGPLGVDVVASAPGPVASGFAARADMRLGRAETPEVVARGTLAALGRRGTTRPGWLSKGLGWSLALLPRSGRVRVMALVMGGMTRHQADSPVAAARAEGLEPPA